MDHAEQRDEDRGGRVRASSPVRCTCRCCDAAGRPVRRSSRGQRSVAYGSPNRRPGTGRARRGAHGRRRPCWRRAGVDAVLLATSGSHGEPGRHGARGRVLPVLCEKPLAYTRAEADRLAGSGTARADGRLHEAVRPGGGRGRRGCCRDRRAGGGPRGRGDGPAPRAGSQQLAFANLTRPRRGPAGRGWPRLREADERLRRRGGRRGRRRRAPCTGSWSTASRHDLSLLRLLTGAPATVDHVATWLAPAGRPSRRWRSPAGCRRRPVRHPLALPAGLPGLPGDRDAPPRSRARWNWCSRRRT